MSKSSNKPLLVASGCSHTDPNFSSQWHRDLDTSWDKWPAIFGKKHGYEVINVAESGSGNDYIFRSVINAVNENPNTKLVLVLWSGWDRFQIYRKRINPLSAVYARPGYNETKDNAMYNLSKIVLDNYWDLNSIFNNNIFYMWTLQDFLKRRNIKYIFAQGVRPIVYKWEVNLPKWEVNQFEPRGSMKKQLFEQMNLFLNHTYYDDLDVENFCGWPAFEELGGNHLLSILYGRKDEYTISPQDGHPNAKGQEKLFEIFSKVYKKIYA